MPQRIVFVPAILVILIATVSMGARSGLAADSCAGKPGATAPQGEHWYYRLDRTAHRLCWYLGPEGGKVAQAGTPHLRSATRRTDPHPAALATAEPSAEALAAFAARTGVVTGGNGTTLGENPSEPRFITRWSNHPGPSDATAYEVASTSSDDAARPASVNAPADLLPTEPVRELSARATAGVSNETPFGFVRMLGLIGGALAFAVLIVRSAAAQPAGGLTARSKSLDHERSSAAVFRPPVGAHSFGIPRSFGRRSAGAMRRNVIAGEPGDRDDSGHSLGAAWILSQAIRDR